MGHLGRSLVIGCGCIVLVIRWRHCDGRVARIGGKIGGVWRLDFLNLTGGKADGQRRNKKGGDNFIDAPWGSPQHCRGNAEFKGD